MQSYLEALEWHLRYQRYFFDKCQTCSDPPTPTHLTPLESCQKMSKNVTNVTGDMISGKYAQTCVPIPLKIKVSKTA